MLSIQVKGYNVKTLLLLIGLLLVTQVRLLSQTNSFISEITRFKAMIDKDSSVLDLLIHEDLVYSHSNGLVESKTKYIHSIMSGYIEFQKINNEDFKLRIYENLALTNGIIKVMGAIDKKPFDIRLLYSAVYLKVHNKFQLLNWQSTKL